MALSIYTKSCAKNIAGNNAVLVTEASNISSVTVDASGEVTAITMVGAATFKQLQADQDSILRTQEAAGSDSSISYTHSIQMGFAKGSTILNTLRDSLADASACGIVAIVQDANGKSWLVGYNEVDKTKRALRLVQDNYASGASPADEDVQKADVTLESVSGYVDLPLDSILNTALSADLIAGGGTAISWSPGAGFSTEYQTVYDSMTNKPSPSVAAAQNTMVAALVSAGAWSKLDVFYLFAQETNAGGEALLNWLNPATHLATLHGTADPSFTSLEGFTGDGVDAYIDTNFNPFTEGVNYLLDDAMYGVSIRALGTEGVFSPCGCSDATAHCRFLPNRDATSEQYGINGFYHVVEQPITELGTIMIYRDNATNLDIETEATNYNYVNNSDNIPSYNFYVLADNSSGSGNLNYDGQVYTFFAGSSLSAGEMTAMKAALEVYMDSNGKGVV